MPNSHYRNLSFLFLDLMRFSTLPKVYPITCCPNRSGLDHVGLIRSFLKGGARFFQVREKSLSDSQFYRQLIRIKKLCVESGAKFVVNDRVDLAMAVGADGVHLGQTDLPVSTARHMLGEEAIIGISTHNRQQFKNALTQDINYLSIGPVFTTSTKENSGPSLGLQLLGCLAQGKEQYPVVALGGISLSSVKQVLLAGADSVAVISDIVNSPDPAYKVSEYLSLSRKLTK